MRLLYRIGLAALLIFAVVFFKNNLETIRDDRHVQPFWQFSLSGGPHSDGVNGANTNTNSNSNSNSNSNTDTNANADSTANLNSKPNDKSKPVQHGPNIEAKPKEKEPQLGHIPQYETTPITVPNDRVIVMAKLAVEDTSWVSQDLNEWRNVIYTVDDPSASHHTPINKGRESLAYLQYIIEHYNDLPAHMIFLHSHRDGWPGGWHTDNLEYSNVLSVRALQPDTVLREGFVSLRCQESPGCPEAIRPTRDIKQEGTTTDDVYAKAWRELFLNNDVPEVIGAPCCSQFAVSRDAVLARPIGDYHRYYNWVINNDLPDEQTAHIMEYTWHIIFGKDPVFCPDMWQCYADVFGNPSFW